VSGRNERSKQARAELDRSFEGQHLIRLRRNLRATKPIDGVVVGRGIRWVLIKRLTPDLDLDGYSALRWKHVGKVRPFAPSSLAARSTLGLEVRATPLDVVDTTTTGTLLRSLARRGTPISIHAEQGDRSAATIGIVTEIAGKTLHLLTLDLPDGRRPARVSVSFDTITRVDFDSRYLSGLGRAARPASRPQRVASDVHPVL
jgi:hypothetical protein